MKFNLTNTRQKLSELWDCTVSLQSFRFTDWLGSSYLANQYVRPFMLRLMGFKIGKACYIRPGITMQSKRHNFSIGDYSTMNMFCYIDAPSPIQIGRYCNIGPNVYFINGTHEVHSNFRSLRPTIKTNPIIVEDFVWIAANVTILNSVRIGQGSVVAAGALVTKDVPPNCLVGGVPAKVIKYLNEASESLPEEGLSDATPKPPSSRSTGLRLVPARTKTT